jgi:hypothetical protein
MSVTSILNKALGKEGSRELKTGAIAAVLEAVTGSAPVITRFPEYNKISFSPEQAKALQAYIERQLAAAPSDVRIDLKAVAFPIVLKRAIPYMIGAAALGAILVVAFKGGR